MTRQRGEEWLAESPPPNRIAASPYKDDDFYNTTDNDSQQSYDADEGSPSKSRRDGISLANAFDFINTLSGGRSNESYNQSFVMEPSPKTNDVSGSLHHRYQCNNHDRDNMTPSEKTPRYDTNDYDDESPQHRLMRQRPILSPHKHHAIEQLHDKNYKSSKKLFASLASRSTTRVARWIFAIVLSFYLILLTRTTYQLRDPTIVNRDVSNAPDIWDLKGDCYIGSRLTRGTGCQRQLPSWYQDQRRQIEDARSKREARRNQRRDRTKLPSSSKVVTGDWHRVLSLEEKSILESTVAKQGNDEITEEISSDDALASIDLLCGISAKNSSLVSPQSYPTSAALNKRSRVLITGVLNPVGLSLALRLKQECGVQNVLGVDAMYPNTVMNRLLMQDRIKLLNSNPEGVAATKPVVLPFFGLDLKTKPHSNKNGEATTKQSLEDEMTWMRNFKPTHIVHLGSYSMDVYNDVLLDPKWKNTHSPYISADTDFVSTNNEDQHKAYPYFYPLRSDMVSMEQLLQTIAGFPEKERPQFLYASNPTDSNTPLGKHGKLFRTMKLIDELLADTYHSQNEHGLPSIGLRLPNTIYGPWGHAGSTVHDILVRAVEENVNSLELEPSLSSEGRTTKERNDNLDLLFVDDAVDAMISALQHRPERPTMVTVPSERTATTEWLSSMVQSMLHGNRTNVLTSRITDKTSHENSKEQSLILPKTDQTPLKYGLAKSIAWHLDRSLPFGTPPSSEDTDGPMSTKNVETGDEFLQRNEVETCEAHAIDCHKNNYYLPCSSECNIHQNCVSSVFDETRDLLYNVSEGCEIVMYTQMLGYNVEDAELVAEYMDDSDLSDDELLVCNFAFVPRESDLVSLVTGKVPSEQLVKFGIESRASDRSRKDLRERKLDTLNGRLLYRGWILIWVKDGMRELSTADASLMKLSPSKFFHPSVNYGLFVEENFKVSPNLDDVLFLVDQMHRRKLESRSLKKEEKIETPHGSITKKVKIEVPGEPQRRAAILLAPLRVPNIDDPFVKQYKEGDRKLTIQRAAKFMGYEVGYQQGDKESASLKRQREFYERIPAFVNKNELRSNIEPWYRYSPKHWVRSRWVLHDFTLEEARLLRCDWYQEHVQWGNDLDQLSFAKVMGMRDLKRRVVQNKPDDHVKSLLEERPELHDLTDFYEWHSLGADVNKLYRDPVRWGPEAKDDSIEETHLYVRIMSERVMDISRKIWNKMKKRQAKEKREREEI